MPTPLDRPAVVFITRGHPFVDSVVRAVSISHRHHGLFLGSAGEPASVNRELLVESALASNPSHLLLLDENIVAPLDIIERLQAADRDVVSAVYPQWVETRIAANYQPLTEADWAARIEARLQPVRRIQLGAVLITRALLLRLPRPWFLEAESPHGRFCGDDEWFSDRVRQAGAGLFCDGRVVCSHMYHGLDLRAGAEALFTTRPTPEPVATAR
jgi:hypothetical protein